MTTALKNALITAIANFEEIVHSAHDSHLCETVARGAIARIIAIGEIEENKQARAYVVQFNEMPMYFFGFDTAGVQFKTSIHAAVCWGDKEGADIYKHMLNRMYATDRFDTVPLP